MSSKLLLDGLASTYYFDAHIGTTNSLTRWTNPANAFDGIVSTAAVNNSGSGTSTIAGYLLGQGTNSPTTGGTVSSVQARLYGSTDASGNRVRANIYTSGQAEQLADSSTLTSPTSSSTTGYGSYITLTAPVAGWSWSTINSLEAMVITDGTGVMSIYQVEILVTLSTASTDALLLEDGTSYLLLEVDGTVDTLTDTLTAQDTTKWTQATAGSATIAYSASGMTVTFPASSTASTVGSLNSVGVYDLTSSSAYAQIASVPSAATSADGELRLERDANNWLRFVYEGGTLFAQKMVAGSRSNVATLAYSSTNHKWWKISESGGTVTFWTAPDSSSSPGTWTSFGTTTPGFLITNMQAYIAGSCFQAETSPGTFTAFNFNTSGGGGGGGGPTNTGSFFAFF